MQPRSAGVQGLQARKGLSGVALMCPPAGARPRTPEHSEHFASTVSTEEHSEHCGSPENPHEHSLLAPSTLASSLIQIVSCANLVKSKKQLAAQLGTQKPVART